MEPNKSSRSADSPDIPSAYAQKKSREYNEEIRRLRKELDQTQGRLRKAETVIRIQTRLLEAERKRPSVTDQP